MLLDEIGRGTSTYDGVAIAWAVTEHLHDRVGCKTMFATHYHELMQLPERLQHARNYNVAVRETGRDGRVPPPARAGRHRPLVRHPRRPARRAARARSCAGRARYWARSKASIAWCPARRRRSSRTRASSASSPMQPPPDPVVEELTALDVDTLTPLEALNRLAELKRRAGGPADEPVLGAAGRGRWSSSACLGGCTSRDDGTVGAGRMSRRPRR